MAPIAAWAGRGSRWGFRAQHSGTTCTPRSTRSDGLTDRRSGRRSDAGCAAWSSPRRCDRGRALCAATHSRPRTVLCSITGFRTRRVAGAMSPTSARSIGSAITRGLCRPSTTGGSLRVRHRRCSGGPREKPQLASCRRHPASSRPGCGVRARSAVARE